MLEEEQWDGVLSDDGLGVYEILNEKDPADEEDNEIDDTDDLYTQGLKRFDEPSSAVDEPTKEINLETDKEPRPIMISTNLPPEVEEDLNIEGV